MVGVKRTRLVGATITFRRREWLEKGEGGTGGEGEGGEGGNLKELETVECIVSSRWRL